MGDDRKSKKQYMFLGFPANPTGSPNPELGSGLIFNPDMFKPVLRFFGVGKKKPDDIEGPVKDTTDSTAG